MTERVRMVKPSVPKTFVQYVRSFGPGFVVVLTWLGSGDIISAGVSGGNYGYALMWAMVFALLMRYFFVTTIAKYQLCNPRGESLLDGLARLNRWFPPFLMLVILFMGHIQATYMVAGISEICVDLTGIDLPFLWASIWVVAGLALVFRPLYTRVEWLFKVFIIILSASLLGTAIWVRPDIVAIIKGTFTFSLPVQEGPFSSMLVAMGMVGAVGGSLMNLVYPYFLEQKGWRGPEFRRVQTYDFILAIAVMILFNLAVWILGAELVHKSGERIETLDDLTRLLSTILGSGGRILFLVGVFAAVYTSLLGMGLGLGYLGSHAYQKWRKSEGLNRDYRAHWMYKFLAVWVLVSPLVWIALRKADFVSLTLLANTVSVVLIPALAGGLWWITASSRYVGEKYRNRWWENSIMAFLFVLSLWGTVKSIESIRIMVDRMMK